MKTFPVTHFTGPFVYLEQAKLLNRRVLVARGADGHTILVYRALRGWKDVSTKIVTISGEATEATIRLLLESRRFVPSKTLQSS